VNQTSFSISESGDFLLSPGDYSIPIMAYCMKSSSASPAGHTYTLSRMEGKLAPIIRKLNLKAPYHFSSSDIQIVLWSLQAGLSYEEMTEESQRIIDQVIPEHREELREFFLSSIERKWDRLSEQSAGKLPNLSESISRLPGEAGTRLKEMRDFRNKLREVGHDYEELSRLIDTTSSNKKRSETPWSKVSENIYTRFVTEGSFEDIGFLQVRVLAESGRKINSESEPRYSLNITSLVANPNNQEIQPLSFSPLFGMAGVVATTQIATNPRASALLIVLALAVYPMNWDDFFKLEEILKDVDNKDIQKEIEKGKKTLRKEHDELEKPLKETGIISGKTKKTSIKESDRVREYKKTGGIEQLEKDYEKVEGTPSKVDGLDLKTLSDGTKILKRPQTDNGPTLEVQPGKNNPKYPDEKIRIKVRYP